MPKDAAKAAANWAMIQGSRAEVVKGDREVKARGSLGEEDADDDDGAMDNDADVVGDNDGDIVGDNDGDGVDDDDVDGVDDDDGDDGDETDEEDDEGDFEGDDEGDEGAYTRRSKEEQIAYDKEHLGTLPLLLSDTLEVNPGYEPWVKRYIKPKCKSRLPRVLY